MNDLGFGRVGRDSIDVIARRAAEILMGRKKAWSVCLDPDGWVTVENPSQVNPDDWIGTWDQSLGSEALHEVIANELRDAVVERGIKGEVKYRQRVYAGRGSARRAA